MILSMFQTIFVSVRSAVLYWLSIGIACAITVIPYESSWNYLDDGSDQGTSWRTLTFDDSNWSRGNGQFGYGDGDESTVLTTSLNTYYFRHEFNLPEGRVEGATMNLLYDDGAVVYINGTEVYRTSLLPKLGEIAYNQASTSYSSDNQVDAEIFIAAQYFKSGNNLIAVEVHNQGTQSSDISFDLNLQVKMTQPNAVHFTDNILSVKDAQVGQQYRSSLLPYVKNPSGHALTFELIQGPNWLKLGSNGELQGIPAHADAGNSMIRVQVKDAQGDSALATVKMRVLGADGLPVAGPADVLGIRLIWANDPATTATIAWTHAVGPDAQVHYDTEDHGRDADAYAFTHAVDRTAIYRGDGQIESKFARLSGLQPDTAYYFVLRDHSGVSERYWFRTAPDHPQPFTFITGGDSRNNRLPRQQANRMVAQLRPLFVAFTGDMISSDNAGEWNVWFEDWQETVNADGQMIPILPHRGNHEANGDSTIYNLFDTTPGNYYGITFGGDLLRFYVLNSENAEASQAEWLSADLDALGGAGAFTHLMAGYHKPMRPHQAAKSEGSAEYAAWAQLFYEYGFDLIFESDSHVMKRTLPLAPSVAGNSEEGFVVDTERGTIYTGEGCWGAPLRAADDLKGWTVAASSFNGFDYIRVTSDAIELFTVMIDEEPSAEAFITDGQTFQLLPGIPLWQADGAPRLVIPSNTAKSMSQRASPLQTAPHPDIIHERLAPEKE
jgi:hypothetical protein